MKPYYQYCYHQEEHGIYVISEYPPDPSYKPVSRIGCNIIADMSSNTDFQYKSHPEIGQIVVDIEERKIRVVEIQHLKKATLRQVTSSS
jgi:hypothetical protein